MSLKQRLCILGIACISVLVKAQQPLIHPEIVLQTAHGDWVDHLAFSTDGKTLVSRGQDGSLKVWDLAAKTLLRSFERDQLSSQSGVVEPVSLSPHGDRLLVGRMYGYADDVTLANPVKRDSISPFLGPDVKPENRFKGPPITAVAESNDERWKVVANADGTIVAFDSSRNAAQIIQRNGPFAMDIHFDSQADRLLIRRNDSTVLFRDLDRGVGGLVPKRNLDETASFGFGPRGELLIAAAEGDYITLSDSASGSLKKVECHCTQVMLSGNGKRIAAFEGDAQQFRRLRMWSTQDLREITALTPPPVFMRAVLSDDGEQIAFGGFDGSISILQANARSRVIPLSGSVRTPTSLNWISEKQLAVIDSAGGIQVWDLRKGSGRNVFRSGYSAHPSLSNNGRFIVAKNKDNEFLLYDFSDHSVQTLGFPVSGSSIFSLAVSDDGSAVAWSSGSLNGVDLVDRAIAAVQDAMKGATSDSGVKGSNVATALPLFLARHTPQGWVTKEVCQSENRVPSGYFIGQRLNTIGCKSAVSSSGTEFDPDVRAAATQSGTVLTAVPQRLHVLQGTNAWDIKLNTFAPLSSAISPDQHWGVVLSETDAEVFDLETRKSFGSWIPAYPLQLDRFASAGGSPMVAIADEGTTFLINGSGMIQEYSPKGNLILSLATVGDQTWVVIDKDGRFDTTDVAQVSSTVKWRMPDDPLHILPLEIFMRDYYTPQLLPKLVTNQKLSEVPSLAQLNRVQPSVRVVAVEEEADDPDRVTVRVEVSNQRSSIQKDAAGKFLESGVYDVRLFRDDRKVGQWPKDDNGATAPLADLDSWRSAHKITLDSSGKASVTFRHINLPRRLGIGKVEFTAYAFNNDRVKSPATPPYEYTLKTHALAERRAYLITMGVNANQSPNLNLELAVSSAEAVRAILRNKLSIEYPDVIEIQLYSDIDDTGRTKLTNASKADLKAVLDLLAGHPVNPGLRRQVDPMHRLQTADPDDAVIIYIASHGYADPEGAFYLMPYDTNSKNWGITEAILTRCQTMQGKSSECARAHDLLNRAISSSELASWWNDVDAGELVMILDSCHSAAASGKTFRPGPLGDPGFGQLAYDKGMQILSASQPAQAEHGEWVTGGEGQTLLVDALKIAAQRNPENTLEQWLRDTEDDLPRITKTLYPTLQQEDVEIPLLLDFVKSSVSPSSR